MNAHKQQIIWSPWEDASLENPIRTEMSLVNDPIDLPMYKSLPAFEWIYKHKAEDLLCRSLTRFAPLSPVISYKGQISSWLSPPISGSGNTVLLILSKDNSGAVRLVGTNYANWPKGSVGLTKFNFFEEYDSLEFRTDKERLIVETISSHMNCTDTQIAKEVAYQAELVRTMPIALLVLDINKSFMAFSPAVVYGNHPADFSKEFMGEVL